MLIQHPSETTLGQPPENAFVAFDSHGRTVGAAAVCETYNDALYPERPLRYRLDVSCPENAFGVLVGAALARAMMLRVEKPEARARVYIEIDPDDALRLSEAKKHGFEADDALVKMRRTIQRGPITTALPDGAVAMRDALDDPEERRYFIERYAQIMNTTDEEARLWLRGKRAYPKFMRLLAVSRDGLAGELLLWVENRCCEIGHIWVAPDWRKKGVGGYLLEMARLCLCEAGVPEAFVLAPKNETGIMRLLAAAGYRQAEAVKLYAGMNL